jgi:signal transduction histidine kinase
VRDLHDGAQAGLVHVVVALEVALQETEVPGQVQGLIDEALDHARSAMADLRELAHGVHPAVLTYRGLAAAVRGLATRATLPIVVEIAEERYPPSVESAAYFVAAEALTNVAKYAQASVAHVRTSRTGSHLVLTVDDDGIGGARPSGGTGLAGLADRLAALDGTLTVSSEPGEGTHIRAEIPLSAATEADTPRHGIDRRAS